MKYFAIIDGGQSGPFTLEQLAEAGVTPETYVWCKTMDDWQQAADVADICRYFRNRIYDRMHPSPEDEAAPEKEPKENPIESIPLRWRGMVMRSGEEIGPEMKPATDNNMPPRTFFVESIIVILCCGGILALVALYYSQRCRVLWQKGEKEKAIEASRRALVWLLVSMVAACFGAAIFIRMMQL